MKNDPSTDPNYYRYYVALADFAEASGYLGELENHEKDTYGHSAFAMAATIAYCRPFTKNRVGEANVAKTLPSHFLDAYSPIERNFHEKLKSDRDKHLAHSDWERRHAKPVEIVPINGPSLGTSVQITSPLATLSETAQALFNQIILRAENIAHDRIANLVIEAKKT